MYKFIKSSVLCAIQSTLFRRPISGLEETVELWLNELVSGTRQLTTC